MSDNKHAGRGGKGYYIALILCAAAIGITSYVYYRNANRAEEVSIQESVGEDILVGTMEAEDVPALATQPQTQSTPPATQGTTPAPTAKKPFKTTSPVSGEEISAYSMEALSYNETTRDWRVHNGVDIAADAGFTDLEGTEDKVFVKGQRVVLPLVGALCGPGAETGQVAAGSGEEILQRGAQGRGYQEVAPVAQVNVCGVSFVGVFRDKGVDFMVFGKVHRCSSSLFLNGRIFILRKYVLRRL